MSAMALDHALLVALSERPGAGLELTRRFEKSIGFFWQATHQQIYRVLARMAETGWVSVELRQESGKPEQKVYAVTPAGQAALREWLAESTPTEAVRSELAVKLRGASYGDRAAVLATVRASLADHATRLAHFEQLEARDYPHPDRLTGAAKDQYLVLRGGIHSQRALVTWLTEYLEAYA